MIFHILGRSEAFLNMFQIEPERPVVAGRLADLMTRSVHCGQPRGSK